ncbi:protein CONSERVED IN THE GREEN LINEAGE AND DIATOMS 27, chloroplastic-like [Hordeum vulgare subsp. vulgare]|uniref:protein CONSERVED IN THE GREEN LINEAGE AND DIATOMS 27, chloroplastic-like n=1 Tax=Hordeum vulgare subsp. vulgare TaxID=112509 RepID=UPI001D1A5892|nr:protein CONSERVED IN THE GREEN LINEAGE AND DIATOMS 27, chloroplastic-like [Hordeum vulgare subsp. vulgare]
MDEDTPKPPLLLPVRHHSLGRSACRTCTASPLLPHGRLALPLGPRLLPLLPNPARSLAGPRRWPRRRLATAKAQAVPPSRNGSSAGTDWCPVPPEQRPVNDYEALAASLPFSWAARDLVLYCSHLAFTEAAFALFVGLPVAVFGGRGGAGGDTLHLALGATGSGILAVTLAVVRMYLGWAYIGNRTRWLSLVVEAETEVIGFFLVDGNRTRWLSLGDAQ